VVQPRFFIGFGLYAGMPIPYPVAFGYPAYVYGSPVYAPPPYGSPSVTATPPPPNSYGGISFDITPDNAEISIDGSLVGPALDFSPTRQPLTLTPGRHHVEIQAPGMTPLAFDVDVLAGEVIPYRGALQPQP
jgi:hypothetical protein